MGGGLGPFRDSSSLNGLYGHSRPLLGIGECSSDVFVGFPSRLSGEDFLGLYLTFAARVGTA